MSEYFANQVDYLLHEKNPRPNPAENPSRPESRMSVQIGGRKRWRQNPVSFGARPQPADNSAIELGVAAAIEVDEVQSCGGVRDEWVGTDGARVFFFPFACVSEHTWFTEAMEMNRVR